jgi:outer membrane lipoprotein-sorting protein
LPLRRIRDISWSPRLLISCGLFAVAAIVSSCAAKAPTLPMGTGTPFPEYASAYADATKDCRGVNTITVSMAMSGKAGTTKLRGRIDAGFAAPSKARLEGIPPFGKPVFVLVADGARGTLVLTRDDRVLRDAPFDQIVEALAGVAVDPDALRTIVSGCGFPDGAPTSGSALHANGGDWVVLAFAGSTGYLVQRNGTWRLAAATRGPLTLHYTTNERGRPEVIDIRATKDGRVTADIHLRLEDVDVNTTLDSRTFDADVPAHPIPLTLDELRRAGPLGGS